MSELVKPLIARLKQAVSFVELRGHSSDRYLEAVLVKPHLEGCITLLREVFGPPLKEFGQPALFDAKMQKALSLIGGIRTDQALSFAKDEAQLVAYASLWPWASDATRVKLKVGLLELK